MTLEDSLLRQKWNQLSQLIVTYRLQFVHENQYSINYGFA